MIATTYRNKTTITTRNNHNRHIIEQKLESFTEERYCAWVYEPYRGQPLDGAESGP